ncbi:MAG TPA: hypothetical protein VF710_19570 [Longimicrobium sp.]|jgi:hypothetical protein
MTLRSAPAGPIERAAELQPSIYLGLGGVIQSLALYFLLNSLDQQPHVFGAKGPDLAWWLRFGTAFLVIVLIWHEYAVGVVCFSWVWTVVDSAMPFLLGMSEFLLITHVRRGTMADWFWSLSVVSFVGGLSYLNQFIQAQRTPTSATVFEQIRAVRVISLVSSFVCCLAFLVAGCFANANMVVADVQISVLKGVFLLAIVFLGTSAYTYNQAIKIPIVPGHPDPVTEHNGQRPGEPSESS